MRDWFETRQGLLSRAWDLLEAAPGDIGSPARTPVLATTNPEGWPEARTVVLRAADRLGPRITVYTDLQSHKVTSLRAAPRAAFHIWEPALSLQLRLQVMVTIENGNASRSAWEAMPDQQRQSYGATPPPGRVIDEALAYTRQSDRAAFAMLRAQVVFIDLVHLGQVHRRAAYSQSDDWAGQWLSP